MMMVRVQVIDFGSSCYEHQRIYTYIQSRFYRAPEVILGSRYALPIDMWSLGCILAELATGCPLFPGEDESDQLACIIELCGMPPARFLATCKRARNFISSKGVPRYCAVADSPDDGAGGGGERLVGGRSRRGKYRGPPATRPLSTALKVAAAGGDDAATFVDFVERCLVWEPAERMTPTQALRHVWLRRKANPAGAAAAGAGAGKPADENAAATRPPYRRLSMHGLTSASAAKISHLHDGSSRPQQQQQQQVVQPPLMKPVEIASSGH